MLKLKTRRSIAKRFKFTAKGKILRRRAFKSHLLSKRASKRKRRLSRPALVSKTEREKIKRLLPYG